MNKNPKKPFYYYFFIFIGILLCFGVLFVILSPNKKTQNTSPTPNNKIKNTSDKIIQKSQSINESKLNSINQTLNKLPENTSPVVKPQKTNWIMVHKDGKLDKESTTLTINDKPNNDSTIEILKDLTPPRIRYTEYKQLGKTAYELDDKSLLFGPNYFDHEMEIMCEYLLDNQVIAELNSINIPSHELYMVNATKEQKELLDKYLFKKVKCAPLKNIKSVEKKRIKKDYTSVEPHPEPERNIKDYFTLKYYYNENEPDTPNKQPERVRCVIGYFNNIIWKWQKTPDNTFNEDEILTFLNEQNKNSDYHYVK